jgi:hypothetical protein
MATNRGSRVIRLAIDQDQVTAEVAVAAVPPLAEERVVAKPLRQRLVGGQQGERVGEHAVELCAQWAGLKAFEIPLEPSGAVNRPHRN